MVDKEVSKTFAETRVGSSPIFGTKGAHSNFSEKNIYSILVMHLCWEQRTRFESV